TDSEARHLDSEPGLRAFRSLAGEVGDGPPRHEASEAPLRARQPETKRAGEARRRSAQIERTGHDVLGREADLPAAEYRRAVEGPQIHRGRGRRDVAERLAQHLECDPRADGAVDAPRDARGDRGFAVADRPERLVRGVV